jgi:cupin fold WbuC family metalloprotein
MMDFIEAIRQDDRLLCLVVRPPPRLERTTFVTPDQLNLQLGFIVTPRGGAVPRHSHLPVERRVTGTSEVVMVRSGRCSVDIYDEARNLVASRELSAGDIVVLVAGGHAFTMAEDTVLMEVKQGPYAAEDDKERF